MLALSLPSCGYRFGSGEVYRRYASICVPFVEGDKEGIFTSSLIKALTTTGSFAYKNQNADLVLKACLLPPEDTTIGFEYAPADKGDNFSSNIIVANEARLTMAARVTLVDRRTGMTVLGPFKIGRYLDYDFDPDLSNINFRSFALGQLEMRSLAQDAAMTGLSDLLAEKIVDYINHAW